MKKYNNLEIGKILLNDKRDTIPETLYFYVDQHIDGDSYESEFYESREECESDMKLEMQNLTKAELKHREFYIREINSDIDFDEFIIGNY